jgi:hypothetical protein
MRDGICDGIDQVAVRRQKKVEPFNRLKISSNRRIGAAREKQPKLECCARGSELRLAVFAVCMSGAKA